MKLLSFLLLVISCFVTSVSAVSEKPNTVLIHPGEDLFVCFDESTPGLKLISVSKEKTDKAQISLSMAVFDKENRIQLLVVKSSFSKNLFYKAEMRLLTKNRRMETSVVPVRANLSSFESWPHPIEELALYGFELK